MNDAPLREPIPFRPPAETPVEPNEVDSAGRSCLVILLLGVVLLLVLCVGLAARWASG